MCKLVGQKSHRQMACSNPYCTCQAIGALLRTHKMLVTRGFQPTIRPWGSIIVVPTHIRKISSSAWKELMAAPFFLNKCAVNISSLLDENLKKKHGLSEDRVPLNPLLNHIISYPSSNCCFMILGIPVYTIFRPTLCQPEHFSISPSHAERTDHLPQLRAWLTSWTTKLGDF